MFGVIALINNRGYAKLFGWPSQIVYIFVYLRWETKIEIFMGKRYEKEAADADLL